MARDDEQVLVAWLSAGDTGAFDEVYDVYRPRVFAFLLRMTRNRALAEDLLDETWLRLVRHATRLLPDTRLGPWLFTVARNLYWSHRRDALLEESFVPELLTLWPSRAPWPSPFDWRRPVNSSVASNVRCRHSHHNIGRSSCLSVTRA
jgi:DNA-directed RNA polymerase specialized sigma24 family protein